VRQCVAFHQIFLRKINDSNEGSSANVDVGDDNPKMFDRQLLQQYGLSYFQSTSQLMKGIINCKSMATARHAQE